MTTMPRLSSMIRRAVHEQKLKATMAPTTWTVWDSLIEHSRPDGRAWPGLDLLMAETGLARRTVLAALAELVRRGFMETTAPGHRGRTAERRLTTPDAWGERVHHHAPNHQGKGAKNDTKGCKKQHERVHHHAPRMPDEVLSEPMAPSAAVAASAAEDFSLQPEKPKSGRTDAQKVVAAYVGGFERMYGRRPILTAKANGQLARLAQQAGSADAAVATIVAYLADHRRADVRHDVAILAAMVNQYLPTPKQPQRTRQKGTHEPERHAEQISLPSV